MMTYLEKFKHVRLGYVSRIGERRRHYESWNNIEEWIIQLATCLLKRRISTFTRDASLSLNFASTFPVSRPLSQRSMRWVVLFCCDVTPPLVFLMRTSSSCCHGNRRTCAHFPGFSDRDKHYNELLQDDSKDGRSLELSVRMLRRRISGSLPPQQRCLASPISSMCSWTFSSIAFKFFYLCP